LAMVAFGNRSLRGTVLSTKPVYETDMVAVGG